MKQDNKAVLLKLEAAQKKLSKLMGQKGFDAQAQVVRELEEQIHHNHSAIVVEEAGLSSLKRSTVKSCMDLKFTGIFDSCRRGIVS